MLDVILTEMCDDHIKIRWNNFGAKVRIDPSNVLTFIPNHRLEDF
jgi:hypothetical protein